MACGRRPRLSPRPADRSILVCAQSLREGNGGIAEVARLTARALSRRRRTRVLACLDAEDAPFDTVEVRGFGSSRPRFVAHLMAAARTTDRIVYDFAGTARAQSLLFASPRAFAVWAHGIEVWDHPRRDHLKALSRADLVLVNSRYTLERAAGALSGLHRVKLCPLATGTDEPPAVIGPSSGRPTVLLLGRVDRMLAKGHDLLIALWPKIVAAVPDACLAFAGGGEALEHLRGMARRSPVARSIDILGFVPVSGMEDVWRRATVMAMPGYAEGFGLVYVEAMRHGIPVIASREDAGQDINIDGVTGFNLSRIRPDAIADAVIALLRDHDLCRRLGAAGHALWQNHYRFARFEERFAAATADFLGQ